MKKLIFVLLAITLLAPLTANAYDYKITFAWDANDPTPDGYRVFSRDDGVAYDHSSPNWEGTINQATIDYVCQEGQVCVTHHVVRAYVGDMESQDSNEVSYTFNGVKPSQPENLSAEYDKILKQITFTWTQPGQDGISKWAFFMKDIDDQDSTYSEIATVAGDSGAVDTVYQGELDLPEKLNHVEFVAVAFNESGVWSDDSDSVYLEINLLPPVPNNTFRINVAYTTDIHPYSE